MLFDIETAVNPEAANLFDPSTVKLGNLKDEEKIAAKLVDAKAKFIERAALSATTGRVLAIGMFDPVTEAAFPVIHSGSEDAMLMDFWHLFAKSEDLWAGFNIRNFDLPFLAQRSWALGIALPHGLITDDGRDHTGRFVDLMNVWVFTGRGPMAPTVSCDVMFRHFGLPGKPFGGEQFAAKFLSVLPSVRQEAVAYLELELRGLAESAARMGLDLSPLESPNLATSPDTIKERF